MLLDSILAASEKCLSVIQTEQYHDLEDDVNQYKQLLDDYLQSLDITGVEHQQQKTLKQIRSNHQAIIQQLGSIKSKMSNQVCTLKRGRKMNDYYHCFSQ